jgi:hypothetical protein
VSSALRWHVPVSRLRRGLLAWVAWVVVETGTAALLQAWVPALGPARDLLPLGAGFLLAWWIMATGVEGGAWTPAWAAAPWTAAFVVAAGLGLAAYTAPVQAPHLWMSGVAGVTLVSAVPLCRRVVRMSTRRVITNRLAAEHRGPGLVACDAVDGLRGSDVEDLAHVYGARLEVVMLQLQALARTGSRDGNDTTLGLEGEAQQLQQTLLDLWLAEAVPGEAVETAQDDLARWRARQEVAGVGPGPRG